MSKESPRNFPNAIQRGVNHVRKNPAEALFVAGASLMLGGSAVGGAFYIGRERADANEVEAELQARGYRVQEVDQARRYLELLQDEKEGAENRQGLTISRQKTYEILITQSLIEKQVHQKHTIRDHVTAASACLSMVTGFLALVGATEWKKRRIINEYMRNKRWFYLKK